MIVICFPDVPTENDQIFVFLQFSAPNQKTEFLKAFPIQNDRFLNFYNFLARIQIIRILQLTMECGNRKAHVAKACEMVGGISGMYLEDEEG